MNSQKNKINIKKIDKYIENFYEIFYTLKEFEDGMIPFDKKYLNIINIQKRMLKRIFGNARAFDNIFNVLFIKFITKINIEKQKENEFEILSNVASIKYINKKDIFFKIKINSFVKKFLRDKKREYGFASNDILYNFIVETVIPEINNLIREIHKDSFEEVSLNIESLIEQLKK